MQLSYDSINVRVIEFQRSILIFNIKKNYYSHFEIKSCEKRPPVLPVFIFM